MVIEVVDVYPRLSVTTILNVLVLGADIVAIPVVTPLDVDSVAVTPFTVILLIVELFCGVAFIVAFAVDAYFTILLLFPVSAVVTEFVSITELDVINGFPVAVNVALTTFDVPTSVDPL